ncbi:MAG: hypothetical protein JWP85_1537 [Rhodoglobus sp.]|nr:hypothetical protein [Rhodoglobus sp.]
MGPQLALTCAAAIVIALSGCGSPAPEPTPSVTAETSPSPTPTPTPTVEPVTLSGCEELLPLALAKSLFSENTEFFGEFPPAEFGGHFEIPEIATAIAAAPQARLCRWAVPNSDGAFALVVAELDASDQAPLIAALTTAGFSSTTMGTVTAMELERDGVVSLEGATHLFTGDVWILCDGTSVAFTGEVAASALDALRTDNPTLGL